MADLERNGRWKCDNLSAKYGCDSIICFCSRQEKWASFSPSWAIEMWGGISWSCSMPRLCSCPFGWLSKMFSHFLVCFVRCFMHPLYPTFIKWLKVCNYNMFILQKGTKPTSRLFTQSFLLVSLNHKCKRLAVVKLSVGPATFVHKKEVFTCKSIKKGALQACTPEDYTALPCWQHGL